MLNTQQLNTQQLNAQQLNTNPANTLAKSIVAITNPANTLAKSTVNVISPMNASLRSTVNIESSRSSSLYIFSAAEQLQAILVNQGVACPFYNPVHDEKINLENIFTFEIPSDHPDSQYVVEGNLVAFQDLDNAWQVFEIKQTIDIDDTITTKQVFCEHAYYELLGDIVPSGGSIAIMPRDAIVFALVYSRWEIGNVVMPYFAQSVVFSYQTALECLQQVAKTWKGELQFRIIFSGNQIVHRYVDLMAQRGSNKGKQFAFGKDLEKVEREVDYSVLHTAIYGLGAMTSAGARLTFASINGGIAYVTDSTALALYGLAGGTKNRFGIFDDSQEIDPAVLLTKTRDALNIAKVPIVKYTFQVVLLEQISPDYAHEVIRIGDTVTVVDDNFIPVLQLSARVINIKWNLLEYSKTVITLGNFVKDLADVQVTQDQINQQISKDLTDVHAEIRVKDILIVYRPSDAGVSITKDGAVENWTWTKNAGGKITYMGSDRGRTITITY